MIFSFFPALLSLALAQYSPSLSPVKGSVPPSLKAPEDSGKNPWEREQSQDSQAREAVVVAVRARVYLKPDFDSYVLRTLPRKTKIWMSNRLFGAFYRVRLSDGSLGFMTDVDIRALSSKKDSKNSVSKTIQRFSFYRFWGLAMAWMDFQEDSMERRNRATLQAFALKFVGADLLGPGSYPMDISIQFVPQAPSYYAQVTSVPANGWMLLVDSLLLSGGNRRLKSEWYYGLGPLLRFSRFESGLPGMGSRYSLEDLNLGLSLGGGLGVFWGRWQLRTDLRFFWERTTYGALQLGVLRGF